MRSLGSVKQVGSWIFCKLVSRCIWYPSAARRWGQDAVERALKVQDGEERAQEVGSGFRVPGCSLQCVNCKDKLIKGTFQ